jgi:thiol:disulfide interchange protein DsbD
MNFQSLRIVLILILTGFVLSVNAQIFEGAKWSFKVEQTDSCEAILIFKAKTNDKFHIYSQFLSSNDGPIPTSFTFNASKEYERLGKVAEGHAEEVFDQQFQMKVKYFHGETEFKQKIKIKSKSKFNITGYLTYMACDDEKCLPPTDVDFSFEINSGKKKSCVGEFTQTETTTSATASEHIISDTNRISNTSDSNNVNTVQVKEDSLSNELEPGCGDGTSSAKHEDKSLMGIFIAGFIGGLLALLTPCVFPMIPMTVSFFTKRSGSRKKGLINSIIYSLSIIIIYVGLGFLVTITLGSDALNDLASNAFFNLTFFIVFLVFAFSFFGAFEIVLPSSLVNKVDSASDRGGLIGIFFMAFTLSLVSFSCTGPIIGTLLVEAAHGGSYLGPLTGMGGFAIALALPFGLFSAFPGWLNSLPKSGGWLNTVKVSLGFIELALAFKFLSNVDLAYHWGFLQREIFIAIWVIIFGLMGFYLLGKLKFSHDSDVKHISVTRLMFAIITLTFTLYLIPGIWGAPLKLISGFPPPEFYKEWKSEKNSNHCPHNLNCYHDYDAGMAYARSVNKPVMVDFTGWSCVNCRKMEDNVWSDPEVLKRLSDKYVLISLYVDDKEELPADKQYVSTITGKKIRTVGNKWSELQTSVYKTNSQPYYVLLDHHGKLLAEPKGYTPDIKTYLRFLDEGLCRYEKRK